MGNVGVNTGVNRFCVLMMPSEKIPIEDAAGMKKIYGRKLGRELKYFRKIHIYHGIWLVSLYAKRTQQGKFPVNIHNILCVPLSFIMVPVKVIDWSDAA